MSFVEVISRRERRKPRLSTCLCAGKGTHLPVLWERQEVVATSWDKYCVTDWPARRFVFQLSACQE